MVRLMLMLLFLAKNGGFWSAVNPPSFAESSGPVKAQVANRMTAAYKGMASRKEELEIRGNLKIAAQVEYRERSNIVAAPPLGENFSAQGPLLAKVALELPATKGIVSLVRSRIDGITASPIGRPGPPNSFVTITATSTRPGHFLGYGQHHPSEFQSWERHQPSASGRSLE